MDRPKTVVIAAQSRGVASVRLSEANLSLAETLLPPPSAPTNRLSAY